MVVGDFVEVVDDAITKLYPRFSQFVRPNIANVNFVNVIVAPTPKPDFLLVDKMIISAINGGAKVIITVNKCDLSLDVFNYVSEHYSDVVNKIFAVSTVTNQGVELLKNELKGNLCAFFGQSAVGKTSLLNTMFGISNRVGEVSQKTLRGRHTTTSSQIHTVCGTKIVDTPGFSALSCQVKSAEIKECYPEFVNLENTCYYIGCTHTHEPDCAVKLALDSGKISVDRYNRYVEIYKTALGEEKNEKY